MKRILAGYDASEAAGHAITAPANWPASAIAR